MNSNICSLDEIHSCTGCGMCSACCPCNAITIKENVFGFYRPVLDKSMCIGCSLCTKVCYRFDDGFSVKDNENHESFSAIHKDNKELESASSGAVSIALMKECIRRGYYVLGVAYDYEDERAVTKIAKTESELEQFKGSKYIQSYTADAFREVIKDKSEQKYAIFGTPCQIYAFANIAEINGNRDRYILVDIFCHGCPSLKLWSKYLEYIKEQSAFDKIDHISFRSKSHGWHEYCFDFFKGNKKITSSKYNDPFFELFFGMDIANEACYDCIARSTVEKTDIRMGDFWGRRYSSDTNGVSAVIISSEIGRDLFLSVSGNFDIKKVEFNEIIDSQSYKKNHPCNVYRRERVLALLNGSDNIKDIVKKRRKMLAIKTNIKREMKSLLKHLPRSVYIMLKNKLG